MSYEHVKNSDHSQTASNWGHRQLLLKGWTLTCLEVTGQSHSMVTEHEYQSFDHPTAYIMMTSSNGNIFRVTGLLCVGNSPLTSEFPTQRQVTRSFDVFFGLRLNKRFSKQSSGWWFETPSRPLWRLCNDGGSLGGLSCSIFRPCYWETKIGVYRRTQ